MMMEIARIRMVQRYDLALRIVRSDVRNPCCEVASFSDVTGVERVD
jgi:hypothetical protein